MMMMMMMIRFKEAFHVSLCFISMTMLIEIQQNVGEKVCGQMLAIYEVLYIF